MAVNRDKNQPRNQARKGKKPQNTLVAQQAHDNGTILYLITQS